MTTYIYPTSVRAISDSFADHVARKSVNPGTDYECPRGTVLVSVAAGVVTDADGSPAGSGGRTIHVDHDDGTGADYLHLNALSVSAGDRVAQGQKLGYTGASGFERNDYYGPHLHISFRKNHSHGYWNDGNVDFQAIMDAQGSTPAGGGGAPLPPVSNDEVEMKLIGDTITAKGGAKASGTIALVGAGYYFPVGPATGTSNSTAAVLGKLYGDREDLTHEEFVDVVHAHVGFIPANYGLVYGEPAK